MNEDELWPQAAIVPPEYQVHNMVSLRGGEHDGKSLPLPSTGVLELVRHQSNGSRFVWVYWYNGWDLILMETKVVHEPVSDR